MTMAVKTFKYPENYVDWVKFCKEPFEVISVVVFDNELVVTIKYL